MKCPCNPQKTYDSCCKPAHQNINTVQTAEQLMRSRYSAFVLAEMDYLQLSHHSTTRPSKKENKETQRWTKAVKWIRLEILSTEKGTETDTEGTVAFKALFFENGLMNAIHEKSRFVKENGHWVYVDGLHH